MAESPAVSPGTLAGGGRPGQRTKPGPCRGHQLLTRQALSGEETCLSSPVAAGETLWGETGGRLWLGPWTDMLTGAGQATPSAGAELPALMGRLSAVHQGSLGRLLWSLAQIPGPQTGRLRPEGRGTQEAPGQLLGRMSSSSFGTSALGPKECPCKMQERAAA